MKKIVYAWMFVVSMLVAVMVMPGAALAEGTGFYVGAGLGMSEADQPLAPYEDFDDSDMAIKLFVGYAVNKGFAIEAGYTDLGSFTLKQTPGAPDESITQEATALFIAGVGSVPLSDKMALIAKIGLAKWESDLTESAGGVSASTSKSGLGTMFGLGFQFDLKPILVRVEYEQYQDIGDGTSASPAFGGPGKYDGTDIDVFGVSVAFRF